MTGGGQGATGGDRPEPDSGQGASGDQQPRGRQEKPQPDSEQESDEDVSLEDLMAGFRGTSSGATARFAAAQAAIIRDLVGQVIELIGADDPDDSSALPDDTAAREPGQRTGGLPTDGTVNAGDLAAMVGFAEDDAELPDDPVLARLLPDAYRDDPEASGEFRRYTEHGLRSGKAAAARTVLATLPPEGGRIRLSEPEGQAWLRALNDVRLALGTRLGVTDEFDDQVSDMAPEDPRAAYVGVYQWLAFLQETLVQALSR